MDSLSSLENDEVFAERARSLRPFYFIVVCWGENYTNFLFNFCVPSLLSPQNLPALVNRETNKFLIATTADDWQRMQKLTAFRSLQQYVETVFVPIPPCPVGESSCVHMGIGHKLATQIAFEARAYSVLLTPDLMLSDGTMAMVQRKAVAGFEVVLVAALRFGEEPLFKNLEDLGIAGRNYKLGDEGLALIATGRQFVTAGIRSFHSETLRYEWNAPYFSTFPVACWWHVPEEDGVLVHCLSWAPLLVDYNAIEHHDNSMLDDWTIDGDYVYRNFGMNGKIHVVQDSDEAMLVSWAPLNDKEQSLEAISYYSTPLIGNLLKGLVLNATYSNQVFDPLKQAIFFAPVFWHSRDVNKNWDSVIRKASSVFGKFLPYPKVINGLNSSLYKSSTTLDYLWVQSRRSVLPTLRLLSALKFSLLYFTSFSLQIARGINYYWSGRTRIGRVVLMALNGDKLALQKIKRHWLHITSKFIPRRPV